MKRQPRTWTAAEAISALQELACEIGRTPPQTAIDAARGRVPSHDEGRRLFGTVKAWQLAAGLTPNRSGPPPRAMCMAGLHPMVDDNVVRDHRNRRLCRACRCAKLARQRTRYRVASRTVRIIPPDVAARHSPAALEAFWRVRTAPMERAS